MNPVEYIRRDAEGSDSDTRRRAAADLVRSLTEKFPQEVTALFTGHVQVWGRGKERARGMRIGRRHRAVCTNEDGRAPPSIVFH